MGGRGGVRRDDPHTNTMHDNQANRKASNTKSRIFHSAVGDERRTVAKRVEKRDEVQEPIQDYMCDSCSALWSEKVDGIMEMSEADGMAS